MKMEYKNGLLFATVELTFCSKTKLISDIVIDTGAAESIISSEVVEEIGIYADSIDKIKTFYGIGGNPHYAFAKRVERIRLEDYVLNDVEIDFGLVYSNEKINGLLGLDILVNAQAIINLKDMIIDFPKN